MSEASQYRALVIDDEPVILRLTVGALEELGFQCDTALDGIGADALLSAHAYHAVVVDLRLPNKHGYTVAMDLLLLAQRPVIVIHTGAIDHHFEGHLRAAGVDAVIFKPMPFDILAAKVLALVRRRFLSAVVRVGPPSKAFAPLE
jgi:two-component system response regulator TctD